MEIAFAAVDIPSLIEVVAIGASRGLLVPVPPPAISEAIALCPGFSLIIGGWLRAASLSLRWSSKAAAPVSGAGEIGENVPLNRGDFGDGEPTNPAFVMLVRFVGFCVCSVRDLFNDFVRAGSDSALMGASDRLVVKTGADTPPCCDAMECSTWKSNVELISTFSLACIELPTCSRRKVNQASLRRALKAHLESEN